MCKCFNETLYYVPRITLVRRTRFEVAHQARGFEAGVFDAQGLGRVPVTKLVRNLGVIDSATLQQSKPQ
jgi:hypothetical protein